MLRVRKINESGAGLARFKSNNLNH